MSLEELISTYGYIAVGIGTFLEGETILILAGFACHRGLLEFPLVVFWAFLGTLLGDQLFFYIGRIKGQNFLNKRKAWQSKSEKVFSLLKKHQILLILSFRFLYGLRTVLPFLIGASDVNPLLYLILNTIRSFFWALVIGAGGYAFGNALELLFGKVEKYEMHLIEIIMLLGALIWGIKYIKRRLESRAMQGESR